MVGLLSDPHGDVLSSGGVFDVGGVLVPFVGVLLPRLLLDCERALRKV